MNVLEEVLKEELDRIKRLKTHINEELKELPNSYISKKIINKHEYFYEQKRIGSKVHSKYLKKEEKEDLSKKIDRRRELKIKLKELNKNEKQINKLLDGDGDNE